MDEISKLISTVGFPIGAYILQYVFVTKTMKDLQTAITESNSKLSEVVDKNTDMLSRLITKTDNDDVRD